MKRFIGCLILVCSALAAHADVSNVAVSHARVRLLPGDLPLAGYFVLGNQSSHPITLIGASCPDFAMVMMHRSVHENGMDRMVGVKSLEVAPGKAVRFAPGGYHLMLMHRRHPMHVGDMVPITLHLADGGERRVEFRVVGATDQ